MYSEEVRREALGLVSGGMTPLEASRAMGGSPSNITIMHWAEGHVPSGRRSPRTVCTAAEKLAALRRMESGEHYKDVARDVGCTPSTLLTWRRKYAELGIDGLKTYRDIRDELQDKARSERSHNKE